MSDPAVKREPVLRVAIVSDDPARRARLAVIVAAAGHAVAPTIDRADVVLATGHATESSGLPTVLLGGQDEEVAGRLPVDATDEQIDAALRAVANGLVVRLAEASFEQLADENLGALLTPREIEVLSAVSAGFGNKAIARSLDISLHTVKFHLESIFRKLGVRTRAEAVARGLQRVNL